MQPLILDVEVPSVDKVVHSERPCLDLRVMILSDAIPNRNGVGTYYHDLMQHLRDGLAQVEMIPARSNCIFKKKRVAIPLPGDNSQHMYLPNVTRILREVRKEQPDLILAPTIGPFGLLARLISKYRKIPLVVGYHTSLDKLAELYWEGRFGAISNWYLRRASRIMFRDASAVVVNTAEMAEEARNIGAHSPFVMGTTIAHEMLDAPVSPATGRFKRVLYGGRLAKEKNVLEIAAAAEQHPELSFVFAGEGPLRSELEERTKSLKNVTLTGWLDRQAMRKEIDAADVVVLASRHESFGSIALEVMARERIMLVSRNCGILQWQNLARGLAVIESHESVSEALSRLSGLSVSERIRMARNARLATTDMNHRTKDGWLELMEMLCPGGSPTR